MSYLQAHTADLPVTQPFGSWPGGLNPAGGHTGKDIGCPVGTPVYAACDGVIEIAGNAGPWNTNRFWIEGSMAGISVVLNDPTAGGAAFTYNHLSRVNVKVGQRVKRGDIIAWTGNTGASTGPHDHFECLPDGWNFQNGTYGRINPDIVCKAYPGALGSAGSVTQAPPNGRYVGGTSNVLQRDASNVDGNIVRTIPAGQLEIWEGYVHGQPVTVNGLSTDIWYQDKLGYAWAGGFESQSTEGLPDLTPRKTLEANQRRTGPEGAKQRAASNIDGEIIRLIPGGQVEVFTGYVHGQEVTVGGFTSDVWYVDAKGFAWSGAFEDTSVVGLSDLTVVTPPAPPVVVPEAPELGAHLNGIDVAQYQEKASLNLIGTDFYIIKASEGGANWHDSALESNVAEARLTGKPIGFYHYARPLFTESNTAAEEARSFLSVIAPYVRLGDFFVLDWEAENQHRTDWALEWLRIVQKATGGTPLLYINTKTLNDHAEAWAPVEAEFPLWLASYGTNQPTGFDPRLPAFPVEWAAGFLMWQYTSRGRLPNYNGDLDLNVFYGTQADLIALGATKLLTEPVPNPPVEPELPPVVDPVEPTVDEAEQIVREYQDWLLQQFIASRGKV